MLSVILPASNEEAWIGGCLEALFASEPIEAEVIVVANGCRDRTAEVARGFAGRAAAAGWRLTVLEQAEGSKPAALNTGDAAARGGMRCYLDADVRVSPGLMAELVRVLGRETACYASGTPVIAPARSGMTRAYGRFWARLPFLQTAAPGFGLFAVNAAGRARWDAFPGIISDDTFVRCQFQPGERVGCAARYSWPMVEGFGPLVRVRRRQDAGVAEIARLYPGLLDREAKPPLGLARLAGLGLRDPVGLAAYAAVSLAVRLRRGSGWTRGR